jgi:hypothetical protein
MSHEKNEAIKTYIEQLIQFVDQQRDKAPDDQIVLLRHRLTEDHKAAATGWII